MGAAVGYGQFTAANQPAAPPVIKRIKDVRLIPDLLEYGKLWHARSQYRHIPFNDDVARETARSAIIFSNQALWTYEEQGKIQGMLIGALCQYAFSKKRYATDSLFFADKGGQRLFYTLREWAKGNGVAQLQMGVTSGIGDAEQVGKLYELNGMKRIGGIYVLNFGGTQ